MQNRIYCNRLHSIASFPSVIPILGVSGAFKVTRPSWSGSATRQEIPLYCGQPDQDGLVTMVAATYLAWNFRQNLNCCVPRQRFAFISFLRPPLDCMKVARQRLPAYAPPAANGHGGNRSSFLRAADLAFYFGACHARKRRWLFKKATGLAYGRKMLFVEGRDQARTLTEFLNINSVFTRIFRFAGAPSGSAICSIKSLMANLPISSQFCRTVVIGATR